jgi:hypothetical protein
MEDILQILKREWGEADKGRGGSRAALRVQQKPGPAGS